jgi:hypothetical protein
VLVLVGCVDLLLPPKLLQILGGFPDFGVERDLAIGIFVSENVIDIQ